MACCAVRLFKAASLAVVPRRRQQRPASCFSAHRARQAVDGRMAWAHAARGTTATALEWGGGRSPRLSATAAYTACDVGRGTNGHSVCRRQAEGGWECPAAGLSLNNTGADGRVGRAHAYIHTHMHHAYMHAYTHARVRCWLNARTPAGLPLHPPPLQAAFASRLCSSRPCFRPCIQLRLPDVLPRPRPCGRSPRRHKARPASEADEGRGGRQARLPQARLPPPPRPC